MPRHHRRPLCTEGAHRTSHVASAATKPLDRIPVTTTTTTIIRIIITSIIMEIVQLPRTAILEVLLTIIITIITTTVGSTAHRTTCVTQPTPSGSATSSRFTPMRSSVESLVALDE
jgi:hypothetical protein